MRKTLNLAVLLGALLAEPAAQYGLQLMAVTGLCSGTLYPLLARLEAAGLVAAEQERGAPRELGRPLRRYYLLTPAGARFACEMLAALPELPVRPG